MDKTNKKRKIVSDDGKQAKIQKASKSTVLATRPTSSAHEEELMTSVTVAVDISFQSGRSGLHCYYFLVPRRLLEAENFPICNRRATMDTTLGLEHKKTPEKVKKMFLKMEELLMKKECIPLLFVNEDGEPSFPKKEYPHSKMDGKTFHFRMLTTIQSIIYPEFCELFRGFS